MLKPLIPALALVALSAAVCVSVYPSKVQSQTTITEQRSRFDNKTRSERFTQSGTFDHEVNPGAALTRPTEAPAGFDNLTNGFLPQGTRAFSDINKDNVQAGSFNDNRFIFEEREEVADGLGPTYNAQSCSECHQNVVTGGASQIAEHRTGHVTEGQFFNSQGGSVIQSRATYPDLVEHVMVEDDVRTFRISTNTLGNGFVEAIANDTLISIRDHQPPAMRGTAVMVPVLEASNKPRIGRFGWKGQHASLKSFAGDAYLNEMGITSPLFPDENPSGKIEVKGTAYDPVPDPEDDGGDLDAFADFMRSTKAPSRGPITDAVSAGDTLFKQIGCAICHTANIVTAPAGTPINGGTLTVHPALGNKIIHPYSDYLLHDIATGDGIPIQPTAQYAATANQIRTAPLWALRTRNRLMHDGLSFTLQEAIARHGGQAAAVTAIYNALSDVEKANRIAVLNSL